MAKISKKATQHTKVITSGKMVPGFYGEDNFPVQKLFRDGELVYQETREEPSHTSTKRAFVAPLELGEGFHANGKEIQLRLDNPYLVPLVRDWREYRFTGKRNGVAASIISQKKGDQEKGCRDIPVVKKTTKGKYTKSRINYRYINDSTFHHSKKRVPYVIGRESDQLSDGHWKIHNLLVCTRWLDCEWDAAYRMREILKMKYEDIASILGRTYNSVQRKIDRARNQKVDEDGTNAYHLIQAEVPNEWHWFEVDILASMRSEGYSFEAIAIALGRTEVAVRTKARQEGIK